MEFNHISVLLKETIQSLNINEKGTYVDCTAGGGGHSAEILAHLGEEGRLICIDQDPDAITRLTERFSGDDRVTIVNRNFACLGDILSELSIEKVDGILADLGVSSYQLDTAERGFSVHNEAPLDMRMSKEGMSAFDVVNNYSEYELRTIIKNYGEEKFVQRVAAAIVRERDKQPISSTTELAEIVKNAIPAAARRTGGHPARKTFQAIRIEVNGELEKLENTLDTMFSSLKENGVLSIITFHSLEDRMVKRKFQTFCQGCVCPPDFPICVCGRTPAGRLPFKFKTATEEELAMNQRSRSATLRSVEKIHELCDD